MVCIPRAASRPLACCCLLLALTGSLASIAGSPPGGPCPDQDGDGSSPIAGCGPAQDCNDADPAVHPSADERCDGYDNDCDGAIDEAPGCTPDCDGLGLIGPEYDEPGGSFTTGFLVAWTGEELGTVWTAETGGTRKLLFAPRSADGIVLADPVAVTPPAADPWEASLIWNGSEYALVWSDFRTAAPGLYFIRFDATGRVLKPELRVTAPEAQAYISSGALIWTGTLYALTWYDLGDGPGDIFFARVSRAGQLIGDVVRVTESDTRTWRPSVA